jgi:hypothetical protein
MKEVTKMKNQLNDKLHALDRVMYLLEENSFLQLSKSDKAFAAFIEELYAKADNQQQALLSRQA